MTIVTICHRDSGKALDSMYLLANEVLDTDGNVKRGKKKCINEWEKKWGVKFMENGFAVLQRFGLNQDLCHPRDLLHQLPLGVYGEYIVRSTVHTLIHADSGLGNPKFWKYEHPPITDVKVKGIWTSLAHRMANIQEDDAGFTISAKMSKHFFKVLT